jgi:hypothetical protein
MAKNRSKIPTKKRVHRDPQLFHQHYNYVQTYRRRVVETITNLRNGELNETDLDKLQNFSQFVLHLRLISKPEIIKKVWRGQDVLDDPSNPDIHNDSILSVLRTVRHDRIIDEELIDKLEEFCRMSLKLMDKSELVTMRQAWQDIEIRGWLNADEDSDVVLDPVKQGRDPQDEPQHTFQRHEHAIREESSPAAGSDTADCQQTCDEGAH